jgi:hypothetical protein
MEIDYKLKVKSYKLKEALYFLILTFNFLLVSSCSFKKVNPPPPDLIDEKQMAVLIADLSISEAALSSAPIGMIKDSVNKINVLREHNIKLERYLLSFKYYSENPQQLKDIYTEATGILNAMKK